MPSRILCSKPEWVAPMRKLLYLLTVILVVGCGGGTYLPTTPQSGAIQPEDEETGRVFRLSNGALSNFLFTAGPGYNGVVPPVNENSQIGGQLVLDSSTNNQLTVTLSQASRRLNLGIFAQDGEIASGETFSLMATPGTAGSNLILNDTNASWSQRDDSMGSITITELHESQVGFDFDFSNIQPASGTAAGPFAVSGHIQASLQDITP